MVCVHGGAQSPARPAERPLAPQRPPGSESLCTAPLPDLCAPPLPSPDPAPLQIGLGFLLPMMLQACSDYSARMQFVRRHKAQLGAVDRGRWLAKAQGSFSPWAICLVVFVNLQTALWYMLAATAPAAGQAAAAPQQRGAGGAFPAAMAASLP